MPPNSNAEWTNERLGTFVPVVGLEQIFYSVYILRSRNERERHTKDMRSIRLAYGLNIKATCIRGCLL